MPAIVDQPAPPTRNQLLAGLPEEELRALAPKLQYVHLPLRKLLFAPDEATTHVYFPTDGIVSLLHVNDTGASTELALIGREGMVGVASLLGGHSRMIRVVVQAAGHAYRMPTAEAKARFAEGGQFQQLALRFTYSVILQVSQTAVCNLHHSVEQHLCRWLLLCLDRLQGNEIRMTHELIADMLGVRRQGVTEAARKLQSRRIIEYNRGHITVVDRHGLERSACECYRILKTHASASDTRLPR
jgi:CRP-like cAMP-binding protein